MRLATSCRKKNSKAVIIGRNFNIYCHLNKETCKIITELYFVCATIYFILNHKSRKFSEIFAKNLYFRLNF